VLTLSLSEKEIESLKRSIDNSLKNCLERGFDNNSSAYKTLNHILDKLHQFDQHTHGPLVSTKEVDYKETILEY